MDFSNAVLFIMSF